MDTNITESGFSFPVGLPEAGAAVPAALKRMFPPVAHKALEDKCPYPMPLAHPHSSACIRVIRGKHSP